MNTTELDRHRRTVETSADEASYVALGEGPVVLFDHGVGTSSYLWRNVVERLAGHPRCMAIDLPLHGHTPGTPDQDYSLPGLAHAIEAVCVRQIYGSGHQDIDALDRFWIDRAADRAAGDPTKVAR